MFTYLLVYSPFDLVGDTARDSDTVWWETVVMGRRDAGWGHGNDQSYSDALCASDEGMVSVCIWWRWRNQLNRWGVAAYVWDRNSTAWKLLKEICSSSEVKDVRKKGGYFFFLERSLPNESNWKGPMNGEATWTRVKTLFCMYCESS